MFDVEELPDVPYVNHLGEVDEVGALSEADVVHELSHGSVDVFRPTYYSPLPAAVVERHGEDVVNNLGLLLGAHVGRNFGLHNLIKCISVV